MKTISLNSNKMYNNKLVYLKLFTMKIKKSIYKLKDNKKTLEDLRTKVILINDLGE